MFLWVRLVALFNELVSSGFPSVQLLLEAVFLHLPALLLDLQLSQLTLQWGDVRLHLRKLGVEKVATKSD